MKARCNATRLIFLRKSAIHFPRLRRYAPDPRQFRCRHEAKPLRLQSIHNVKRRIHRAVAHIVQQNHIAILHRLRYKGLHRLGIVGGPVPGIHRPVKDRQTCILCSLLQRLAPAAAGRSQKHRLTALRQQRRRPFNLIHRLRIGHFPHIIVAVTVKPDLVSGLEYPPGIPGIIF